jgi:membrane protease YdiL (CAAX protease family)
MTPDAEPGAARNNSQSETEEIYRTPEFESHFEGGTPIQSAEQGSWLPPAEVTPGETHRVYGYPGHFERSIDGPLWPRLIPHLGHTILFFVIAILVLAAGQALGILLLEQTRLFGHHSFQTLFRLSADDARLSLPVQGLSYALVAVVIIPVFTLLWHEPFSEGVHWNAATARRRFLLLAAVGLAAGFGIGAFGNFLPMPKDPPIMQDMMKSPVGAWMMLAFGITAAPLLEELAFRGFLLPGLINSFRGLARESLISEGAAKWIGIPVSILITSAGFALMHSPQVSHAWGPLVLIGMVSVLLCIIRLAMNSVAAGVVVHAAYNLTLFAGVLAQTGGFRHLERLTT